MDSKDNIKIIIAVLIEDVASVIVDHLDTNNSVILYLLYAYINIIKSLQGMWIGTQAWEACVPIHLRFIPKETHFADYLTLSQIVLNDNYGISGPTMHLLWM